MALHFPESEFSARRARLMARMAEEKLDALLLFAQESMYWLTGYDTFDLSLEAWYVIAAGGLSSVSTGRQAGVVWPGKPELPPCASSSPRP